MIKLFDQTVLSDPEKGTHGDCTRACFRTYTQQEMPLLPHPIAEGGGDWNMNFFEVLEEEYGWLYHSQPIRPGKDYSYMPRVVMAAGPTVRTEKNGAIHLVVYDRIGGHVIHDPHPSRDGLIAITAFDWLEPIEQ